MRSIVIYFSITGNTKKMAQAIHAGMKQASKPGEQCDIIRLRDVKPHDLANYDLIGLGSPVMLQRELGNVTHFIVEDGLGFAEGKHGFAFCTHGASPGFYLARVVPLMQQRGLTMIGWNDWFASAFFPDVPKPYFTDGHPDEIDLKEGEDFGREMVERSHRIYAGETHLIPTFPKGKEYDRIYHPPRLVPQTEVPDPIWGEPPEKIMKKLFNTEANPFKVNKEKCKYPKCTFCIDNCPMDAIDFSVDPPVFNVTCEHCFLCEMACPTGAIEFDWGPFHEVHWKMIAPLEKSLAVFEAEGRFRRLIPPEKIGWDTPFWTLKKPRYKIA